MEYPLAKFVRLKNGDDLITQVVEVGLDEEYVYNLISPYKVLYMQTAKPGYIQIAMVPWVMPRICDSSEYTVDPDDVLILSNASQSMSEYYWETISDTKNSIGVELSSNQEEEESFEEEMMEDFETKRTYH